ncbi:NfeD family protein [Roseateles sp. BYS180W]|uniref:NfeD family protein n=1 Tax=Roseateles rivi TaxID=3299028 RepID=A0ABW7FYG1_9BURK
MNLEVATLWWVACGALIAVELWTGTFYLLMLALGAAAGAVCAHAGLPPSAQLATGAIVGALAVALWHRRQRARSAGKADAADALMSLDVGQRLQVDAWLPDGTAQVSYRGSTWRARWVGTGPAQPGQWVIRQVQGNFLLLGEA